MTGDTSPIAGLRQRFAQRATPNGSIGASALPFYKLWIEQTITIGRDPRCEIVVDPILYASVSRQHAQIRPIQASTPTWQICDLDSSNGTFLNGRRLRSAQILKAGDRILLGNDGPEYVFEYLGDLAQNQSDQADISARSASSDISRRSASSDISKRSPQRYSTDAIAPQPQEAVTFTQLFPIASTGRDLTRKAYLAPGIITIGFVVSLFVAVGQPVVFNRLLAVYIALAAYYFVYRLCGKRKPWWILVCAALGTFFLLRSPILPLSVVIFREWLPGQVPRPGEAINPLMLLIRMFFGAGLMEELIKAIPLATLFAIGRLLPSPWNQRVGIWEPLDGILLGAASAIGFTLVETLGQYVPDMIQTASLPGGDGWNQLRGLQVLIPRLLGLIAGHMAYSGYFGYFVGLSVLKPRQGWMILIIGYLTAAGLHALWNVMGSVSELLLALTGIVSYAFLAAAILKARSLSPTRSQNFATRLKS